MRQLAGEKWGSLSEALKMELLKAPFFYAEAGGMNRPNTDNLGIVDFGWGLSVNGSLDEDGEIVIDDNAILYSPSLGVE